MNLSSKGGAGVSPRHRIEARQGFLSRTDLGALGLPRRAVDAIFRACPVVSFPDYSRPLIRVEDYAAFVEAHTYRGDRVRPIGAVGSNRG
jgi:hypothetical protein